MSFWYRNGVCSNNRRSDTWRAVRSRGWVQASAVVSMTAGSIALAQETLPAGVVARFDLSQRLEFSDNPDLEAEGTSDFFGRTVLGFALDSETSTEQFSFNLGTDIEEGRQDQSDLDLNNTLARLDYLRETANANLGFNLRYRERDVNSADGFDLDGNVIDQDEGTRRIYGGGFFGAFGLNDPIGGRYRLDYSEVEYLDTDDPGLRDQSDLDLSGQLNFRLDPRIIARVTARFSDFDVSDDGVSRETRGLGAGVRLDVNRRLVADFGLSYDQIERSGAQTGTDEGISFTGELTQDMPNGTAGLAFSSDVSSNDDGRRSFLNVSRNLELSPLSSLSMTLGVTYSDTAGLDPLIDLSYRQVRSSSRFVLGLSQSVNSDSDNEEDINTTLRAQYDHDINSVSSIGVNLSVFDRNELGLNPNDGQRYDIGLTYRHDLTKDWRLVSGYTHRFSDSDAQDSRNSNTVFLGLERSFSWNP